MTWWQWDLPKPEGSYHPIDSVSMTKQEFAQSADINYIMQQWKVGVMPMSSAIQGMYGDFSSGDDYRAALEKIQRAEEAFLTLSPQVRDAVGNDPARLLDAIESPEELERLKALGLVEAHAPTVTSVIDDSPASEPDTVG